MRTRSPGETGQLSDAYSYDYRDRLFQVLLATSTTSGANGLHTYRYDHRTRRTWNIAPSVVARFSFSGGQSVQEYNSTGAVSAPIRETIRGSDMGGGVGGVLYTKEGSSERAFNHYNSRGDVVSQTDDDGLLEWEAAYEAFGTRTVEAGTPTGRQRGNTKDEDITGLLNEGMRYRDLEAGVFITRDPAGFVDGPNVYTYVRQNPWSKFDPSGLSEAWPWYEDGQSAGRDVVLVATAPIHVVFDIGSAITTGFMSLFEGGDQVAKGQTAIYENQLRKANIDTSSVEAFEATGGLDAQGGVADGVEAVRQGSQKIAENMPNISVTGPAALAASKVPSSLPVNSTVGSGLGGYSSRTLEVQTKAILNSEKFDAIRAAHASGKGATVKIDGKVVQYSPDLPMHTSGMTRGEDGFIMGPRAFLTDEETGRTIAHELYRLNTSVSKKTKQMAVDQNSAETDAAFDAAQEISVE